MREPVRDKGRLEHILTAIDYISAFTEGFSYDDLMNDPLHLHAVTHNVQIIREAVYKILIEKMRHILVHDYYQINFEILWDILKNDLPTLKGQVSSYLSE